MILSAILLFTAGSQVQDLLADPRFDKVVSISQPADRLDRSLRVFSPIAGVTLTASTSMTSEVLLMRLKDASLRDAMKRIATACGGEWTRKGDGFELVREPGFVEKCRSKLAATRADLIRKNLARFFEQKSNFVPLTPEAADKQVEAFRRHYAGPQPGSRTGIDPPQGNYFSRLMVQLDPAALARASIDGRFVASDRPNSAEKTLDIDSSSPFQAYQADEAVFLDRLKAANISEVAAPLSTSGPPRVLLLVDDSLNDHQSLGIFLVVTKSDGNSLAPSQAYFSMYWGEGGPVIPPAVSSGEPALTLSADNLKLLKGGINYVHNAPVQPPPPDSAVVERIKAPDRFEPLGGYVSELMLGAAESQHLNLVADIPDMYLDLVQAACSNGLPSGAGLLASLKSWPKEWSPISINDKWIEVDGAQMQGYWATRANRKDLADLFRAWKGGSLPLAALANYAAKGRPQSVDFVGSQLTGILTGSTVSLDENTLEPLALLARLTHQFGPEIIQSGLPETSFGKLEPGGREFAISLVYSKNFQTAVNGSGPALRGAIAPRSLPEEIFGSEPSPDAAVSIRSEHTELVLMRTPGQPERTTSAAEIASEFYQRDHQKSQAKQVDQLASTTYAIANGTRVSLTLRVDQYHAEYPAMIEHDAKNSEFVPYESLPVTFKAKVQAQLDQMNRQK